MRGNEHGDAGRRNGHDGVVGTKFFDQREDADDERAAADKHDTEDEDRGDSGAEPAIDAEDETVGASLEALHRCERHHHFGAGFVDQIGNRDKLVALEAQRVDDFGQRLNGVIAFAAAIMEQHDVAVFGLAHDVVDDFLLGNLAAAGKLLPIVRVDFLADDEIAHVLRDRQLRDFFRVFGLMVDAVGRTEQN